MKDGGTKRVAALSDCAAVFAATLLCVVLVAASRAGRWESSALGRPFIEYLVMLVTPLIVLVATRKLLSSHGLWLGRPYYHLTIGLTAAAPFAGAHAVGYGAIPGAERWGALAQSGLMLAALGRSSCSFETGRRTRLHPPRWFSFRRLALRFGIPDMRRLPSSSTRCSSLLARKCYSAATSNPVSTRASAVPSTLQVCAGGGALFLRPCSSHSSVC